MSLAESRDTGRSDPPADQLLVGTRDGIRTITLNAPASRNALSSQMMERLQVDVAEHAVVEFAPKMEGKMMTMILAPKKKTK